MELLVVNQTKYLVGAHATTMLVNEYVNARLGSYGPGIKIVEVTLLYPPKRFTNRSSEPFDAEFRRIVRRAPRVTFHRAKRRVEILFVCRGVSPRSIQGDAHLTLEETKHVVAAVSDALDLVLPRFQSTDRFDAKKFVADAQAALPKCPAAIRRWLAPAVSRGALTSTELSPAV